MPSDKDALRIQMSELRVELKSARELSVNTQDKIRVLTAKLRALEDEVGMHRCCGCDNMIKAGTATCSECMRRGSQDRARNATRVLSVLDKLDEEFQTEHQNTPAPREHAPDCNGDGCDHPEHKYDHDW